MFWRLVEKSSVCSGKDLDWKGNLELSWVLKKLQSEKLATLYTPPLRLCCGAGKDKGKPKHEAVREKRDKNRNR